MGSLSSFSGGTLVSGSTTSATATAGTTSASSLASRALGAVTTVTTVRAVTTEATSATTASTASLGSITARSSLLLSSLEEISVSDEGRGEEVSLGPQVGGKETIGVQESVVGGSHEVLEGSGGTGRGGEDILNTSELQELLGVGGTNDTSTSGGGDQSDSD